MQTTFYPALTQLTEYRDAAGTAGRAAARRSWPTATWRCRSSPSLDDAKIEIVVEELASALTG